MADKRRDPPEADFSLQSLVKRASSRPPPASEPRTGSLFPPAGTPEGSSAGASNSVTPVPESAVPLDLEEISAWGSPTLSSMIPPPKPSRAVPLAIVAGLGVLSAAVCVSILILKLPQPVDTVSPGTPEQTAAVRTEGEAPVVKVYGAESEQAVATSASAVDTAAVESEQPAENQGRDEGKAEKERPRRRKRARKTEPAKPIRTAVAIEPAVEKPSDDSTRGEAAVPAEGDGSPSATASALSNQRRKSAEPPRSDPSPRAEKSETSATGSLPEQPSREQILSALKKVKERVKKCSGGRGITAAILVKVEGKTGTVQSVSVDGVEGSVGLCVAREVYRAKFPSFTKPVFTVRYTLTF